MSLDVKMIRSMGLLYLLAFQACGQDMDATPFENSEPTEDAARDDDDDDDDAIVHPFREDATALVVEDDTRLYTEVLWEFRNASLCEHVYYADGGAGFYAVVNSTGILERSGETHSAPESVTYFELEQLEDWGGGAPPNLTIRVRGGPTVDGGSIPLATLLFEGEELGLLIKASEPGANAGFAGVPAEWVWRRTADDLYSTEAGNLSLTHEELARRIREAYAALPDVDLRFELECRVNVPWDQCPPDALVPEDAAQLEGTEGCDESGNWLPGYEPVPPDQGDDSSAHADESDAM